MAISTSATRKKQNKIKVYIVMLQKGWEKFDFPSDEIISSLLSNDKIATLKPDFDLN